MPLLSLGISRVDFGKPFLNPLPELTLWQRAKRLSVEKPTVLATVSYPPQHKAREGSQPCIAQRLTTATLQKARLLYIKHLTLSQKVKWLSVTFHKSFIYMVKKQEKQKKFRFEHKKKPRRANFLMLPVRLPQTTPLSFSDTASLCFQSWFQSSAPLWLGRGFVLPRSVTRSGVTNSQEMTGFFDVVSFNDANFPRRSSTMGRACVVIVIYFIYI